MDANRSANPLESLKQEHQTLIKKLRDFRKATRALQSSVSTEDMQKLVADVLHYFNLEMANHIYKEESILFPAFESVGGSEQKWLGQSRVMHHDLSTDMNKAIDKIYGLTQDLGNKTVEEAIARLRELDQTFGFILKRWGHHTKIEEEYLFPEMERLLSGETMHKIAQKMGQTLPANKSG